MTYTRLVCIIPVEQDSMVRRLNIVLPEEVLRALDRMAPKGQRSRLISEAVIQYVTSKARRSLAERVKQGALDGARRDLEIAQEWFPLDEESWHPTQPATRRKR